jgi:L-aspartate oxidase
VTVPSEPPPRLVAADPEATPFVDTDVLVVGSGIAGLRAAIAAASRGVRVLLATKSSLAESNTRYAQGGIAIPLDPSDSPEEHLADTVRVGQGLVDEAVAETIVSAGKAAYRELVEWGVLFDSPEGRIDLGREGGHSRHRIAHAGGDGTGLALEVVLADRVRALEHVRVWEFSFLLDLLTRDGRCVGALLRHSSGEFRAVIAGSTVLATGGYGRLYRETTNSIVATGDGMAAAYRAGAALRDMEFVQFHPTVLYIAGAARMLISEAARGEGAILVDRDGRRFMPDHHPQGELAPRDVVSRAIVRHIEASGDHAAWLDLRPIGANVRERFPGITRTCARFGFDVRAEPIPVRPAAHYTLGGVATDAEGRSGLPGLHGCGECTSSGLHGANRLASNSLLEGLIMGERSGAAAAEERPPRLPEPPFADLLEAPGPVGTREDLDVTDLTQSLRSLCWRRLGVMRDGAVLQDARGILERWSRYVYRPAFVDESGWELQNLTSLAALATEGALIREESRGVHFREDRPEKDDRTYRAHLVFRRGMEPVWEPVGGTPDPEVS